MNSRRSFVITILLLICLPPMGWAEDATSKAFDRLLKAPLFAFGGIGVAGTISPDEVDFRTILASPNAEADFTRLLKSGRPEAKCYALVGLRQKNRAAYEAQIKPFTTSKQEVQTCGGCIMMKLPMASVAANIGRGNYDERTKEKLPIKK